MERPNPSLKNEPVSLTEQQEQYLRAIAEADNARKRAVREAEDTDRRTRKRLLLDLLPVVDTLELALRHDGGEGQQPSAMRVGVEAIHRQLVEYLHRHGVEPFTAVGAAFDPRWHEAMGTMEASRLPPGAVGLTPGVVGREHARGYLIDGELLRPARVDVVV